MSSEKEGANYLSKGELIEQFRFASLGTLSHWSQDCGCTAPGRHGPELQAKYCRQYSPTAFAHDGRHCIFIISSCSWGAQNRKYWSTTSSTFNYLHNTV